MQRIEALNILPAPKFQDQINHNYGINGDIINVIHKNLPAAAAQTKELAIKFRGKNELATAKNIWDFLKYQIKYTKDLATDQKIKLPARFIAEGTGDCKSYSLFTAGILQNLNIPFKFRYASYSSNPIPQHVYIVLDSGIIIDAVWTKFNDQKTPTFKKDYKMKISTISGIGCNNCQKPINAAPVFLGEIGKLNLKKAVQNSGIVKKAAQVQSAVKNTAVVKKAAQVQSAVKNTGIVKKAAQVQSAVKNTGIVKAAAQLQNKAKQLTGKSIALSAPRRAYRTLVSINFRGWATKLAANETKAREIWEKSGGSWPEFQKSINIGKSKKPLLGANNTQKIEQINGIGSVLVTLGSVLALAAPLIALFKGLHGDTTGTENGADTLKDPNSTGSDSGGALESFAKTVSNLFSGSSDSGSGSNSPTTDPQETKTDYTLPLLAAAVGAFFLLK